MTTVPYDIPLDLTIQILLRLPPKSVLRFKAVSKSWCSIISSQQFIDAYMSRPHLLLALNNCNDDRLFFFSSLQSCSFLSSSSSSSSSMIAAEKNTLNVRKAVECYDHRICISNSVRGFVCCSLRQRFMVCNPSTGQVIILAENNEDEHYYCRMYLGYDPNSDQYKVLRLMYPMMAYVPTPVEHSVRTLGVQGSSSSSWRPIKTSILDAFSKLDGVCIDGVVYYIYIRDSDGNTILGSFDVGSEQVRLIDTPENLEGNLTNYLGKLAVYRCIYNGFVLRILDDVKTQVWSTKTHVFPSSTHKMLRNSDLYFAGITASEEIVYVQQLISDSFELFYYNMKQKIERRVRVDGVHCSTLKHRRRYRSSLLCSYVSNIIYL